LVGADIRYAGLGSGVGGTLRLTEPGTAADLPVAMPVKAPSVSNVFDWTGFYLGGHLGHTWGNSDWTANSTAAPTSGISGSIDVFQPLDGFKETGSFFEGVQAGYNYMLPNRFVVGAEVDASFPSFLNLDGISIGATSTLFSPLGAQSYSDAALWFGTVRVRIGYAFGDWLLYATGGFAWTYDQLTLTQLASGTSESPFLWRLGWAAGAGVEIPVAPNWTARFEYLFTDYGTSGVTFPVAGQRFDSDFALQEFRAGLNYRFGVDAPSSDKGPTAPATPGDDRVNFHGQTTFVEQAYPTFRSPYEGDNSLPGTGEGRETFDGTLYTGVRLWQGAELWINPEIDQGFGFGEHARGGRVSERGIL
jgi:high affinity Mn2+ porin